MAMRPSDAQNQVGHMIIKHIMRHCHAMPAGRIIGENKLTIRCDVESAGGSRLPGLHCLAPRRTLEPEVETEGWGGRGGNSNSNSHSNRGAGRSAFVPLSERLRHLDPQSHYLMLEVRPPGAAEELTAVVDLRLDVFVGAPHVTNDARDRSLKQMMARREKGSTCLVATATDLLDPEGRPVVVGSVEYSTHEFFETMMSPCLDHSVRKLYVSFSPCPVGEMEAIERGLRGDHDNDNDDLIMIMMMMMTTPTPIRT
jgi:hypothetical protein